MNVSDFILRIGCISNRGNMSEVMNRRQLLASLAIVAALALVGAVAVQVLAVQEAFADKPHGCKPGGNAFKTSGGKDDKGPGPCFHTGP